MSAGVFLWSLALCLSCQYGSAFDFNFTRPDHSEISNLTEYCKINVCLVKCCPEKQILVYGLDEDHICNSNSELIKKYGVVNPDDYSDVEVYNKDIKHEIRKTNKSVNDFKFIFHKNYTTKATYIGGFDELPQFKPYLLEDGKWVLHRINYWDQWPDAYAPGEFCIDHEVSLFEDGTLDSTTPKVVVWTIVKGTGPTNTRAVLGASAMLVSCFFILLVLIVYAVLPQLRNLAGMMLMACMASYFAFFMIRIIQVYGNENGSIDLTGCGVLTVMFYYLMLATFCWINVMSYDIWWKFRSIRKSYSINRRGVMNKFRWYCAYAWGLPVLPTLFVVIVDLSDLSHIPDFVKPHIFDNACYFEKDVRILYVGMPILILNCINLLLFLTTAFNICELKRGIRQKICQDNTNNKKDENRFWLYLKLFTMMGGSWLLEVLSGVVHAESLWWCISDLYNSLVGFFIFVLFVCKKNIILQLCTRFSIHNALVERLRSKADSRAPDAQTKSSASHNTDTSDADLPQSYKAVLNKYTDI